MTPAVIVVLRFEEFERDGARLRALRAHAMSDGLLRVLRYQGLQFRAGTFMLEVNRVGSGIERREFRPGVGGAHIDNTDRLDARFWRVDPKQARRLATLDAAPERLLGGNDEVLVERIGANFDLYPLAAASNHRKDRRSCRIMRNETVKMAALTSA
jgi:hypothetical protein